MRFKMPRIPAIQSWLSPTVTVSPNGVYRHCVLAEQTTRWVTIQAKVKKYFRAAHADAVRHLRRLAGVSIHPLRKRDPKVDPTRNYPHGLELTTLKGYFGEVLAHVILESFGAGGYTDWEVPAFLFRYHVVAFQRLEAQRLDGKAAGTIVGRTGDDSLGFRRGGKGEIIGFAYCEAKCSGTHDSALIAEAHEKLKGPGPVDILNIIAILMDVDTEESWGWVRSLRTFRERLGDGKIQRINLACYVCGQHPKMKETWIPSDKPHASYGTTPHHLDAVEVHITDVDGKIREVYSAEGW